VCSDTTKDLSLKLSAILFRMLIIIAILAIFHILSVILLPIIRRYRGMTWRGEVRYILRGLEGGCAYRNLEVRAINSSGYISLTTLKTIDTIALAVPPREETLLKEYRRALLEEKEAVRRRGSGLLRDFVDVCLPLGFDVVSFL